MKKLFLVFLGMAIWTVGCGCPPSPKFVDVKPENNETVKTKEIGVAGKVLQQKNPVGSAAVTVNIYRGNEKISSKPIRANSQGGFFTIVPLYKKQVDATSGRINTDVVNGQYKVVFETMVGDLSGADSVYITVEGQTPEIAETTEPEPLPKPETGVEQPAPVEPAKPDWGTVEAAGDQLFDQKRFADAIAQWQKIPKGEGSAQLPNKIAEAMAWQTHSATEKKGDNQLAREDYEGAIDTWKGIPEAYRPQQKIADANQKIAERAARHQRIEAEGDQLFAAKNYKDALARWGEIPEAFRSGALKQKMQQAIEADDAARVAAKWASVEAEGDRLKQSRNFSAALQKYESIPADFASSLLSDKLQEATQGMQWLNVVSEGQGLFSQGEYAAALAKWESVPGKFQPDDLPDRVQDAQKRLSAQKLEVAGDNAMKSKQWENALASYQAVPKAYVSPALSEKIEKAQGFVKWSGIEAEADALADTRGDLNKWKQAEQKYADVKTSGFASEEIDRKLVDIKDKIDKWVPDDPLAQGVSEAEQGDYAAAVEQFGRVKPDNAEDYLKAQWNLSLLSLTEDSVQDIDRSIAALENIAKRNNNVYVYYYRGIAHYQKARGYEDILNNQDALQNFKQALELFDEAGARTDQFGRLKIEGVPSTPPEESITHLDYYVGATYYFLYQFGRYDPLIPDETLNGYKLNARSRLISYLRRAQKLGTESAGKFKTEAQTFIKQLR